MKFSPKILAVLAALSGSAPLLALAPGAARADAISEAPPAAVCANQDGSAQPAARVTACSSLLRGGDLGPDLESTVLTNRAWALSLLGKMGDARADYERAISLTPNSHVAHNELGLFFLRTGQFDKAIAEYEIALRLRPGAAYSLYGEGLAYIRKGDEARGDDNLAKARLADSNVDRVFAGIGLRP
jgi:lipoprotein NlpI